MQRKIVLISLVMILAVSFCVPAGYADYGSKYCKKDTKYDGLQEKFFYKAHFILNNEEELGLSEKQVKTIKDLKIALKKNIINMQAQIDLLTVDIKTEMWEDPMNVEMINSLVEEKYAIKKEKTKALIDAYSKLKGVLSEDQKKTLKKLWKQKSMMHQK
jgi:hypothetical protein